jgi:predicted DNA-binding transcriptional regulator AlpA
MTTHVFESLANKPTRARTTRVEDELQAFVGFPGLLRVWPVSKRTIYRHIERGDLPRPIKISAGRVGWPREQIDSFLQNLAAKSAAEAA